MEAPTTESDGCDVIIAWTPPDNGGSPIISYHLEIKSRGTFLAMSTGDCSDITGERTSCRMPLTGLQAAPYFLDKDELIEVRIKAQTSLGWGSLSVANESGVSVAREPD